ncbi:DUF4124 domain-containing protein [Methyloversatilis universalis]|uniref:DUF4124 domain-containing protein n=1 Tax=Methyloversatilis universalis TaxID=378211 RepID=UPI00036FFAB3|nr:DUF4124 domain-containing protein [Methyloversatilis universalis]
MFTAEARVRILAVLLLGLPLACAAQVYQYKDAQGRTVFSDTPPPGANATKKNLSVPQPSGDAARSTQDKLQDFQKRRDERLEAESKASKEQADKDKASENCNRARNRLNALQSGQRIVRFNAQGEKEYIDDPTREKEIASTQQSISEWCK